MKVYEAEKVISLWEKYHHYIAVKAEHFDYELKRLPTVEAEPVRHGKWTRENHYGMWKCSECGCRVRRANPLKGNIWNYYYCPNCGAKMDGTERKEE